MFFMGWLSVYPLCVIRRNTLRYCALRSLPHFSGHASRTTICSNPPIGPRFGVYSSCSFQLNPNPESVCRAEGWGERSRCAVRIDRKRERHARDGVWLPAGGENPGARGFPDSRPTPGPGIAKGEAFSPLAIPRQRQVGKSPQPGGRNRIKQNQLIRPKLNPLRQAQGERLV